MFLVVPAAAMVAATWRLLIAASDERGLPDEPGAEPGEWADAEPGAEPVPEVPAALPSGS